MWTINMIIWLYLLEFFYWEPELCNVVMFFIGILLDIWHNTKTDPLRHYNEKQEKMSILDIILKGKLFFNHLLNCGLCECRTLEIIFPPQIIFFLALTYQKCYYSNNMWICVLTLCVTVCL